MSAPSQYVSQGFQKLFERARKLFAVEIVRADSIDPEKAPEIYVPLHRDLFSIRRAIKFAEHRFQRGNTVETEKVLMKVITRLE
ncbi:hypothetical protein [Acidocella sp.]|jgi:hypothetical protein|uniref:hypothetical protein n=1 Tax=Acidocella sp. TaxID=50710 RepID=UPI002F3FDE54